MKNKLLIVGMIISAAGFILFYLTMGSGGFKRMTTISGVYAVCRPAHYDVVCFLDADSKEGGMFCIPLSQIGGECK